MQKRERLPGSMQVTVGVTRARWPGYGVSCLQARQRPASRALGAHRLAVVALASWGNCRRLCAWCGSPKRLRLRCPNAGRRSAAMGGDSASPRLLCGHLSPTRGCPSNRGRCERPGLFPSNRVAASAPLLQLSLARRAVVPLRAPLASHAVSAGGLALRGCGRCRARHWCSVVRVLVSGRILLDGCFVSAVVVWPQVSDTIWVTAPWRSVVVAMRALRAK